MIKFENTEVMGWEAAIRGMRNPMNSWEQSDSGICLDTIGCHSCRADRNHCRSRMENKEFVVGYDDMNLMTRLRNAGTDHRKFMRMIAVYVDITAPLYWWKEFDTYKIGTVANSCSTMHKIAAKEFTLEDFSCEHLENSWLVHLKETIKLLNEARDAYHWCNTDAKKEWWWQMIQLLPSSYNQKRTVMLNYEVLANIYKSRNNHKLDEWSVGFMDWIKSLPYSELITGKEK
ncbi:MAG: hypothetical protein EGR79_03230 [Ruminococcaceae bacterium]|jgi:hypothetical protein|nr:hypothetical protein [Oscillospiraceae bacterium]